MMKKTAVTLLVSLSILLGLQPVSLAAPAANRADALNQLGVLRGTGNGYDLERASTRAEGLVMMIRLLGAEEEAAAHPADHGFSDVPDWAAGYVAYGVEQGLTNGIGGGKFGSDLLISGDQFSTMVLRALGYGSDTFAWNEAAEILCGQGVITAAQLSRWEGGTFLRGDMADLSYDALRATTASGQSMAQQLSQQGIFTQAQAEAAGVWPGSQPLPRVTETQSLLPGLGNAPANMAGISSGYIGGQVVYDDSCAYYLWDAALYRVPLDGGQATRLLSLSDLAGGGTEGWGNLNLAGEVLYFSGPTGIWRMGLDGSGCQRLSTDSPEQMLLSQGHLYYITNRNGTMQLYDLPAAGGESKLVSQWEEYDGTVCLDGGYLYLNASSAAVPDSVDLVRISLADGSRQTVVAAASQPAGGTYTPEPGTSVETGIQPLADGGWLYYIVHQERRVLEANGARISYPNDIHSLWRVRSDGSGREQLYLNAASLDANQWTFWPYTRERAVSAYTVLDGTMFVARSGSGMVAAQPYDSKAAPAIVRIQDGQAKVVYTGAQATATTYEEVKNLFAAPGWLFFTLRQYTVTQHAQPDGSISYDYSDRSAFYRMRPDGSGLECLAGQAWR